MYRYKPAHIYEYATKSCQYNLSLRTPYHKDLLSFVLLSLPVAAAMTPFRLEDP